MNNPWFKSKTCGWGWYPATWQGWALTLGYLLFLFAGQYVFVNVVDDSNVGAATAAFSAWTFALTVGLCYAAWKTGEKPRWRWGGKK